MEMLKSRHTISCWRKYPDFIEELSGDERAPIITTENYIEMEINPDEWLSESFIFVNKAPKLIFRIFIHALCIYLNSGLIVWFQSQRFTNLNVI